MDSENKFRDAGCKFRNNGYHNRVELIGLETSSGRL